ncbi:MAG: hypothetical protein HQM15_01795 [Deltaproteobacteria bacterium]|nr:hypothetical protein [Deltaproteobacteria bacterium]
MNCKKYKTKQTLVYIALCLAFFLIHCSDQKQMSEQQAYRPVPLVLPPTSASIDLSKLPSLPTTVPDTRPASLPAESQAESLPESSLAKPTSSTTLSIYERLKNAPQAW